MRFSLHSKGDAQGHKYGRWGAAGPLCLLMMDPLPGPPQAHLDFNHQPHVREREREMIHKLISLVQTSPVTSELTFDTSVAVPLGFLKRCLNIQCLTLDIWVIFRSGLDSRFLTCEFRCRLRYELDGWPRPPPEGVQRLCHSFGGQRLEARGQRSEIIFGLLAGPVSVFQEKARITSTHTPWARHRAALREPAIVRTF